MQAVIQEDLAKVLVPFSPEDLRISFVDAESALESRKESDPSFAGILWRKSGWGHFIEQLNRFVREKGVAGRCTTALYSLEQALQEALAAAATADPDSKTVEDLLLQRRLALHQAKARIPLAVAGAAQRKAAEIRQEGRRIAEMIDGSTDPQKINAELEAAQKKVELLAEELQEEAVEIITNKMRELGEEIDAIACSEPVRQLEGRLSSRLSEEGVPGSSIRNVQAASNASRKLGCFLYDKSVLTPSGTLDGLFNLGGYSGSSAHKTIKAVGGFFGKKFKPWEAVKWTRIVAIVGKALQVIGVFLQFYLQYKQDVEAKKREQELHDNRAAVQRGFNEAAQATVAHYDQAAAAFVASELVPEIEKNDKLLDELRDTRENCSAFNEELCALLRETREMIKALHADSKPATGEVVPALGYSPTVKTAARLVPIARTLPPGALGLAQ
jgi:hypothetical protein